MLESTYGLPSGDTVTGADHKGRYLIRLMEEGDIPQVSEIEREAFPTQWPWTPFKRELQNRLAKYLVAVDLKTDQGGPRTATEVKPAPDSSSASPLRRWFGGLKHAFSPSSEPANTVLDNASPIMGFVGLWFMVDEAHVTSIAVRESHRRKGIGELLLMSAIELGLHRNARAVTLEVRVSNLGAQAMYEKYGFSRAGLRKGYYTDNHEDAYVMSTDPMTSHTFQERFKALKEAHRIRWGENARQLA